VQISQLINIEIFAALVKAEEHDLHGTWLLVGRIRMFPNVKLLQITAGILQQEFWPKYPLKMFSSIF
jgi:hypothetical protein